jgi:hypothetical protein
MRLNQTFPRIRKLSNTVYSFHEYKFFFYVISVSAQTYKTFELPAKMLLGPLRTAVKIYIGVWFLGNLSSSDVFHAKTDYILSH